MVFARIDGQRASAFNDPAEADLEATSHAAPPAGSRPASTCLQGLADIQTQARAAQDHLALARQQTPVSHPVIAEISSALRPMFECHANDANRAELDALIADRAKRLAAKGETAQTVIHVVSKARHLDRLSQAAVGAVRSVPFGAATIALDSMPGLTAYARTPTQAGAAGGMVSGIADTLGTGLLARSTANTLWLIAEHDELEAVMAEAKQQTSPKPSRLALEVGAAIQAFSVRNIIRTAVGPIITHTVGAAAAASTDSWIAAIGSPVAGSVGRLAMHAFDEANHRVGPEYLFARKDWEARFDQLKSVGWSDPIVGGAKRLARIPLDVATDSLSAVRSLFTATSVVKNGVALTGGFGAVAAAKAAAQQAARNAALSSPAVEAIGQAVNTALSAPVFSAWTTADIYGGLLSEKAVTTLQNIGRLPARHRGPIMEDIEAQWPHADRSGSSRQSGDAALISEGVPDAMPMRPLAMPAWQGPRSESRNVTTLGNRTIEDVVREGSAPPPEATAHGTNRRDPRFPDAPPVPPVPARFRPQTDNAMMQGTISWSAPVAQGAPFLDLESSDDE